MKLKQWVAKLIEQLDLGVESKGDAPEPKTEMSEDRATILYIIDTYNKNLLEIDQHPVRRTREIMDEFSRELVSSDKAHTDKILFRLRQFFSHYRVDEYTFVRKTLEDFKGILWDFVDQMSEDLANEQKDNSEVKLSLEELREAVESDSIHDLKAKAREFIDSYMERTNRREATRERKVSGIKKNLDFMKKQLAEANKSMRLDHLTEAYNRKSFDERMKQQAQIHALSGGSVSLIILDIDFFKKINDSYGHDVGDFCLKECVRMLKEVFHRDNDFVARIGGEEFAIILQDHSVPHAVKKAEELMAKIRKEVFVQDGVQLRFTVSMGVAQFQPEESIEAWMKRADTALYKAKHSGRNQYQIAPNELEQAA